MIRRKPPETTGSEDAGPKGFDDFELRLGDVMRGERATMGKSLLDVQRELRIKAAYIAAIENCDPSAFDTPGFIAGYVRSYARYLNMDPDKAFDTFCREGGFSVAHGMSAEASSLKKSNPADRPLLSASHDPFKSPNTPFAPVSDSMFSNIEPRAIGSALILIALIAGIAYGGWSVLKEIQQVQVAPVDEAPVVLSDLDPLENALRAAPSAAGTSLTSAERPRSDSVDRLYRPQALDVPVMVARDAPISSLDPNSVGNFRSPQPVRSAVATPDRLPAGTSVSDAAQRVVDQLAAQTGTPQDRSVPQVLEEAAPGLRMVAVRTSWVRVKSSDGTVIYEATMQPGDSWNAPLTEEPPVLLTGESGAIYFEVASKFYGPVGASGAVTSNVPLSIAGLQETYPQVVSDKDKDLVRYAEAKGLSIGEAAD